MSRQNRPETKDTPSMTSAQVVAFYTSRAEAAGGFQVFREDGSPIVGDIRVPFVLPKKKKQSDCHLMCCSEKRAPGIPSGPSTFPKEEQEEVHGWVKVEPRSERRLRKRAEVAYAMTD